MSISKKFAVAAVGVIGAVIVSVPLWSRALYPADPGPELAFVETAFDFGEVSEGDVVVHKFALTNKGTEQLRLDPIVVTEVYASCALPNALTVTVNGFTDTDTVVLEAGASNEIVTTLDTEGFAKKEFDGNFQQRVRVFSNDPNLPRVILHLTGRVKPVIVRDPVDLQVGPLFKSELPERLPPVQLIPTAGNLFRVTKVEANVPYLKPVVSPADSGNGYTVSATIDPSIPEGTFSDVHFTVHTDHPKKPTIVIPISAQVYPERLAVVSPELFPFGLVRPGESLSAAVQIAKEGDASFKVLSAKVKGTGAVVTTSVERRGEGYELAVDVKAPAEAWRSFEGVVEIATNSKARPTINVPFAGWTYNDNPFSIGDGPLRAFVAGALGAQMFNSPEAVVDQLLGGTGDFRGLGLLTAIARDNEAPLLGRVRAVTLMEQYEGEATISALEAIVRSDIEEMVRDEAIAVYAAMAEEKAFPLLMDSLSDKSDWLRQSAATLLGELGDERALPALLKATRDPKPEVALAAVEAVELFFSDESEPQR